MQKLKTEMCSRQRKYAFSYLKERPQLRGNDGLPFLPFYLIAAVLGCFSGGPNYPECRLTGEISWADFIKGRHKYF